MKKNLSLMIGNWVYLPPISEGRPESYVKVIGIGQDGVLYNRESGYDFAEEKRFQLIPLSDDFFIKNGFKKELSLNCKLYSMRYNGFEFFISKTQRSWHIIMPPLGDNICIEFISDLQNILNVTGHREIADNFII